MKKTPLRLRGAAIGTTAAVAFALAGVVGAAPASAATSLDYKCKFPLIGERAVKIAVDTNVPAKVQQGVATPRIQVAWTAQLGADTTEGLRAVDGASLEGVAIAQATANVPETPGGIPVRVSNALKPTTIPASGGFSIDGYGEASALTFTQNGQGTAKLGNIELNINVKKADGSSSALGAFKAPCVQNAGQNNTVASFEIVSDPQTPGASLPVPSYWPPTAPTGTPGTLKYAFGLSGSSFIKNSNGTAPLSGDISVDVDGVTGAITGDLKLNKTKGKMNILGFLPVDVEIDFEQVGKTTGVYANGEIKTTSSMYVKLPLFLIFGFIPAGGGDKCKTKTPSQVTLTSPAGVFFNPKAGGKLSTKSYDIAEILDCNLLTPILSLFASGSGNTIDLNLAPKA